MRKFDEFDDDATRDDDIFNNFSANDHVFKDGASFNKLLFDIPTFNSFNGQLAINGKNSKYKESIL